MRDPPWKGLPLYSSLRSLSGAQTRTLQQQPPQPGPECGSPRDRGPRPHSTAPERPLLPATPPRETPRDPRAPHLPPLAAANTAHPHKRRSVRREPLSRPARPDRPRPHPHPHRGGGAPPGDSTPSSPRKSLPPARRPHRLADGRHLRCHRRGLRRLPAPTAPSRVLGRPARPPRPQPLGQAAPPGARSYWKQPASALAPGAALGGSAAAARERSRGRELTPSPQAPGPRPHRPEVAASSPTRGLSLPGGRAVHMAALRAPEGEGALGEGGLGSRRGEGDAAQPRGPSGANMAGGGGVSRSRRGRGSCGRRSAVLRAAGS